MRAAFSWALLAGLPIVFCKQDLRIHDVANQAAKDEPNGANVADTADAAQANNAAACVCTVSFSLLTASIFTTYPRDLITLGSFCPAIEFNKPIAQTRR